MDLTKCAFQKLRTPDNVSQSFCKHLLGLGVFAMVLLRRFFRPQGSGKLLWAARQENQEIPENISEVL